MFKEASVILTLCLGTAFSYEVCSTSGIFRYYCRDGYYCCSATECCVKSTSWSTWGIIGGCVSGFIFICCVVACICCMRRRRTPGTIVSNQPQQGTVVAFVNSAGPAMSPPYPQAGYPQPTYGQPQNYGQPPSYGQPPMNHGQPQNFVQQPNYAPPSYEQIGGNVAQTGSDKAASNYEQLNFNK